jgi:hypothetical protein
MHGTCCVACNDKGLSASLCGPTSGVVAPDFSSGTLTAHQARVIIQRMLHYDSTATLTTMLEAATVAFSPQANYTYRATAAS